MELSGVPRMDINVDDGSVVSESLALTSCVSIDTE